MDEVFEAVCPALCACWLVPFALIGGLLLIVESFVTGWRWRGLDKQGLFCRRCRFDLRGASERRCTECGAGLDLWGVLAPGVDPPLNLASRVLLVTMGCVGPLILAGVLLAMVVPFNYTTERTLDLNPVNPAAAGRVQELSLTGSGGRAWFGKPRPKRLILVVSYEEFDDHHAGQTRSSLVHDRVEIYTGDVPYGGSIMSDEEWMRIHFQFGLEGDLAVADERRRELDAAIGYMLRPSGRESPDLDHYRVRERSGRSFDPLFSFFLFEFLLGLLAWGLLVRWVVVAHRRTLEEYWGRQQRAVEKLDDWIARNRAGAGLGEE